MNIHLANVNILPSIVGNINVRASNSCRYKHSTQFALTIQCFSDAVCCFFYELHGFNLFNCAVFVAVAAEA